MDTEGAIKKGQSRETGNIGYTRQINVREYRRGNQKGQSRETGNIRVHKKKKNTTQCVGHHYAQTNTNNSERKNT